MTIPFVKTIIPNSGIKFANSPTDTGKAVKDLAAPLVKLLTIIEWSCRWSWAVNPDWSKIYNSLGTVNLKDLAFLNNAMAETVLFTGLSGKRSWWMGTAFPIWDLEYKFAQRYVIDKQNVYSWNHEFNPAPGVNRWQRIKRTGDFGDSRPLYDSTDFLDIFKAKAD